MECKSSSGISPSSLTSHISSTHLDTSRAAHCKSKIPLHHLQQAPSSPQLPPFRFDPGLMKLEDGATRPGGHVDAYGGHIASLAGPSQLIAGHGNPQRTRANHFRSLLPLLPLQSSSSPPRQSTKPKETPRSLRRTGRRPSQLTRERSRRNRAKRARLSSVTALRLTSSCTSTTKVRPMSPSGSFDCEE